MVSPWPWSNHAYHESFTVGEAALTLWDDVTARLNRGEGTPGLRIRGIDQVLADALEGVEGGGSLVLFVHARVVELSLDFENASRATRDHFGQGVVEHLGAVVLVVAERGVQKATHLCKRRR